MGWFKNIRFKWRRKQAMKKADKKAGAEIRPLSSQPKKLFHIALSLTYKNVPMTKANVVIAHYSKDAETAKKEFKQHGNMKISGIKEVKPKAKHK